MPRFCGNRLFRMSNILSNNNINPPFLLIVLDGWGYSEATKFNAIAQATTPVWDKFWQNCPRTIISASGEDVGLPDKQMGNSEVGHMHIGAGRVVYQDLSRINFSITDKTFFANTVFINSCEKIQVNRSNLHIIGLLSDGGVHSHQNHIYAALELAKQQNINNVYIHAILDGRDTPPKSAKAYLEKLQKQIDKIGVGQIASISGRYYAMDRDQRWDRVKAFYDVVTKSTNDTDNVTNAIDQLENSYSNGVTDEFVKPINFANQTIQNNDVVWFMNFRADRARQLTQAFVAKDFTGFARQKIALTDFLTLTEYAKDFPVNPAFTKPQLANVLGEYLSTQNLKQLRIAETEKYAHVTFFFNGGKEQPFPLEDRVLIPSVKVATYDLAPKMSAVELTDQLVEKILHGKYDAIVCNYANADMVGHTGNFAATVEAIETLDQCLGRVHEALQKIGGSMLITADHGNAEKMHDENTNQPHTAHTNFSVPFIYVGDVTSVRCVKKDASLSDVAPTMLHLMGLEIPKEMTGEIIFKQEG